MLCRTCAGECSDYKFLHVEGLFLGKVTTLATLLRYCVDLDFSEDGENSLLPEQICMPCMQKLARAYMFKQMVLDVDKFLRREQGHILKVCDSDTEAWDTLSEAVDENGCDEENEYKHFEAPPAGMEHIIAREVEAFNQQQIKDILKDTAEQLEVVTEEVIIENKQVLQSEEHELEVVLDRIIENVDSISHEEVELDRMLGNVDVNNQVEEVVLDTIIDNLDANNQEEIVLDTIIDNVDANNLEEQDNSYPSSKSETKILLESQESLEAQITPTNEVETNKSDITSEPGVPEVGDSDNDEEIVCEEITQVASCHVNNETSRGQILHIDLMCEVEEDIQVEVLDDSSNHLVSDSETITNIKEQHTIHLDSLNISENEDDCHYFDSDSASTTIHYPTPRPKGGKDDGKDSTTEEPSLKCEICGKNFKSSRTYRSHMKRHNPLNPNTCEFCGKNYRKAATLQKHLRSHTGERPLSCETCGKEFRFPSNLEAHLRQHTGEKPFKCQTCGRGFGTKRHLVRHQSVHSTERPFVCNLCGKAFAQQRYLEMHKIRHTGVKPCQCHICGKSVSRNSELKKHFLTHTGEKPHKCSVCGQLYRDPTNLRVHMRLHTGERPHVCPFCEKAFLTSTQLKQHTTLHTGERPYSCDFCGKAYRVHRSLQRHQLTHTGEKQFKCEVCNFEFRYESNLCAHRRLHERPHVKCTQCDKMFRTQKMLNRHVVNRHTKNAATKNSKNKKSAKRNTTKSKALLVDRKVSKSNIVELY